jgi:hypothetical protein
MVYIKLAELTGIGIISGKVKNMDYRARCSGAFDFYLSITDEFLKEGGIVKYKKTLSWADIC